MALAPSISTNARNVAADAVCALVNAGTPPGLLKIYDNTNVPVDVNASLGAAVLLATLTMSSAAFGSAAVGVATAAAITQDSSADASGTAAFFRITNAAGTAIMQGSVGTATTDLVLNSVAISSGAAVSVTALTYTQQGS